MEACRFLAIVANSFRHDHRYPSKLTGYFVAFAFAWAFSSRSLARWERSSLDEADTFSSAAMSLGAALDALGPSRSFRATLRDAVAASAFIEGSSRYGRINSNDSV